MKATKRKPQTTKNEWEAVMNEDDVEAALSDPFSISYGLSSAEAEMLLQSHGKNELPEKVIPKWYIFLSLFWEPMPVMIWIAIIIEAILCKWMDMSILLAIQIANASIAFYETTKSGDAVAALKASLKPEATVKRDDKWRAIDASLLVPGDLVMLSPGSAIPADCRTNEGTIQVDLSSLTGESLPVTVMKGDSCKMGATVVRGEVEATVEFTGIKTFFGKTAALLQNDNELSNLQNMLLDIMIVLVVISLTLCAVVYLHLAHITSVVEALSFTVVLMVASIPLAIEIVTTTTLALGSKELSKHGAIVTRLSAIEDMAGMAILCSDKTGTLTLNKMVIQEETPVYQAGESQYSLLRYAAMAAKWKEPPKDALDTLTLNAVDLASLENMELLEHVPFDPVVKRTEGTVRDRVTGAVFKTTKGAPHVILGLVDNPAVTEVVERDIRVLGERGVRCLAVARTDPLGEWTILGLLTFLDPPRPDTLQTIQDSRASGVAVKMITGDHQLIAKETSRRLTLGDNIMSPEVLPSLDPVTHQKPPRLAEEYGTMVLTADGFAEVFPEHKYLIVECLREMGYKVGMTGDGVNDAPALKRADIGIAVQGSTDAARAAADIVLTQPGLSTIVHGILIARCIFVRIKNFITYRIAATLQLLLFFFIAIFAFRPSEYEPEEMDDHTWPDFFHMPVIMLMLITLLNDGTLIAIGYDNVVPPSTPAVWNLRVLFVVGIVLAGVACASSLLLLFFSLESWQPGSFYERIGLGGLSYGQITTSIFLKVAVSDFLTLFSARAGENWFWTSRPAPILIAAAAMALSCSTLVACVWPMSRPDGIPSLGLGRRSPHMLPFFIWAYCIVWWFIQDAAKVFVYYLLKKYNIFHYNDTGMVPNHTRFPQRGIVDITNLPIPADPSSTVSHHVGGGHHRGSMTGSFIFRSGSDDSTGAVDKGDSVDVPLGGRAGSKPGVYPHYQHPEALHDQYPYGIPRPPNQHSHPNAHFVSGVMNGGGGGGGGGGAGATTEGNGAAGGVVGATHAAALPPPPTHSQYQHGSASSYASPSRGLQPATAPSLYTPGRSQQQYQQQGQGQGQGHIHILSGPASAHSTPGVSSSHYGHGVTAAAGGGVGSMNSSTSTGTSSGAGGSAAVRITCAGATGMGTSGLAADGTSNGAISGIVGGIGNNSASNMGTPKQGIASNGAAFSLFQAFSSGLSKISENLPIAAPATKKGE